MYDKNVIFFMLNVLIFFI